MLHVILIYHWRQRNYKQIYSSIKNKGGGVHLDLSHEIDYSNWIFEKFKKKNIILKKLSNLRINSYDYFNLTGYSKFVKLININLNYFSQKNRRNIEIIMNNQLIDADLIKNKINFYSNNMQKEKKFKKKYPCKNFRITIIRYPKIKTKVCL